MRVANGFGVHSHIEHCDTIPQTRQDDLQDAWVFYSMSLGQQMEYEAI